MDTRANTPKLISIPNSIVNGHAKTKMETFDYCSLYYTLNVVVICAFVARGAIDIAQDMVSKRLGAIKRENSIKELNQLVPISMRDDSCDLGSSRASGTYKAGLPNLVRQTANQRLGIIAVPWRH